MSSLLLASRIAHQSKSFPKRLRLALGLLSLSLALPSLIGCGGSEEEPVVQAPSPPVSPPTASMTKKEEEPSEETSGEAYGGGAYSEESVQPTGGMGMMGMMGSAQPQAQPAPPNYSGGYPGASGSSMGAYGSSMTGSSGYGMGSSGTPQFSAAIQFVRTNCINCHGPQQPKGDTRLDLLTEDFANIANTDSWNAVVEQLESGEMPPPNVNRRPDPVQQQVTIAWIKSSLIKSDFVPLEDRDYLSQAEYAFSTGKEAAATELLYAHVLAADDDVARETLSQARWFDIGLRPVLTLRFAVGVDLDAPESLDDVKPIGTSQANSAGGSSGMSGYGPSGSGGNGGANSSSERTLQQLTGDFSSALVTSFESRWMDGNLGTPFKDVEPLAPPAPTNGGMGAMGSMGGYPGSSGSGYPGISGSASGSASGSGSSEANKEVKHSTKGSVVTPGLVYIGTGKQTELLKEAAEQGYDGLFLFDVKAAPKRRGGLIENATRLRFMGTDGKTIAATSTLVNIDIERAKMRGQEDDTLGKNIERFFIVFDDKVKLSSLPALKPEHAHDRIRNLLADPQASDLVKLFEARLYHSMDLLSADELAKVYQIVLRGNEGLALAEGTIEDRKMVLNDIVTGNRR